MSSNQSVDLVAAHVVADHDPQARYVLGVGRQRVGRHDPAVLAEAVREVELVEPGRLEAEGHDRLGEAGVEDLERPVA